MGFPRVCNICANEKINAHLFHGNIESGPRPFKVEGTNPQVLLVGQDPTIARGQSDCVLCLENKKSLLYEYIVNEILKPAGLKLENIYATNLVKCRFPDNQTPAAIRKNNHIAIKDFLSPFFHNCRQHFLSEVQQIHPKIVLSFGEPVHQLLIEEFDWVDVPRKMKDAFSNIYKVSLLGDTLYAPCIHVNTRNKLHYKGCWPKFIQSLKETATLVGIP